MASIHNAVDILVSELKVPRDEARVYMLLLRKGKMRGDEIARELRFEPDYVEKAVADLIEKGACIEIGSECEALNPRFAITNIFRMMCYTNHLEFKRNKVVDQLAALLEKPYEDARTK